MKISLPLIVCAVASFTTPAPTSAKPTDGWTIRSLEDGAIYAKALDLQVVAPGTGTHITLRKPLSRTKSLICGVFRPRFKPEIDVHFTAVVEISEIISFDYDKEQGGKVYQFCRKIDMAMP